MFSDFGPTQAATLGGLAVALALIVFLRRSRWTKSNRAMSPAAPEPEVFLHLKTGRRYQVVRAFTDYEGNTHPVGETWVYLRHNFVPYHAGLTLYVRGDDGVERTIRMHWTNEDQGPVVNAFADYVHELPA